MLKSEELNNLMKLSPLKFFRNLSGRLSARAVMYEPRPRSYFTVIKSVDSELRSLTVNWGKVIKMIRSCRGLEFFALLHKLNELKASNKMKEFHLIVGGLLQVRKHAFTVDELEKPGVLGEVLHEPDEIRPLIAEKYRLLFASDAATQPFEVGDIEAASIQEVIETATSISTNKRLAIDCLSDHLLRTENEDFKVKLTKLINVMFTRKRISSPSKFSRLTLLNKLKGETPSLDDLRPIMVTSPIVKIIEAIALNDLKPKIEPGIASSQVGFISQLNTQTNILRLLGSVIDHKENPNFSTGSWMILFLDFKAAFDRVDHSRLITKLELSGVEQRTINIVKLLYNSYHFTLPGGTPYKVNSGVAQGSLISPILYNLYIDDLIRALADRFGEDHVYAYADDVAILCLGYTEVRESL